MLLLRHVFYPTNNLCCSALRSELDALAPEIVVKGKPIEEVHMDELCSLLKCCEISPKFSNAGHFLLWTYSVEIPIGLEFEIYATGPYQKW